MLGITTTNARVGGFRGLGKIAKLILAYFARVIAAGGVTEGRICLSNSLSSLDSKQLLDNASLVLIPSGYEEDILFSQVPTSGLGDLSVVRATTATRVNSAGLIEVVPRNLLTYSEQFDNAAWVKSGVTVTANSVVSPTGTLTADLVTPTISDASIRQSFLPRGAIQHNYSIYLRSATGSSFSTTIRCWRDSPFSNIANTVITVTNEWQRFNLTFTTLDATTHFVAIGASSTLSTGENLYAWGAQVEVGSLTEYLPTVTRLNFPRLDYTNSSCPSLLVEPQRTNLATNSDGNLSTYGGAAVNVTNASSSFNSFANAIQIPSTGISAAYKSIVTTAIQYTISVFVKMDDNSVPILSASALSGNMSLIISGAIATNNLKVESYGNNIYRLSATATSTGINNNNGVVRYDTQVLKSFKFTGIQLEAASFATSYIPTVAAAVTRNAETISKTGISSLIGQTEGTLFFDGIVNNIQNASSNILNSNKNNTTISTFALFKIKATNKFRLDYFLGNGTGTSIQLLSTNSFADGTRTKIAIRYKSGDFAMYINGNLEITSTSTFTNNGVKSELFLNDSTTFFSFQESVSFNQVALYTNTLSNAELASLTTL
jgi:hypothetical protein